MLEERKAKTRDLGPRLEAGGPWRIPPDWLDALLGCDCDCRRKRDGEDLEM
jgi:hypothetical protein